MNIAKYFLGLFLLGSTAWADGWSKQCSATWNANEAEGSRCLVQFIENGFALAPTNEQLARYQTQASCLAYCNDVCNNSDGVTLCVQRRENSSMRICREKELHEGLGILVPETKQSCQGVDVD